MGSQVQRKPRILCLHGFRTSAEILKKLVLRWPATVLEKLDLVFLDGPYPAQGKSAVEGFFDPPYYEWFQANQDYTEYTNFEECLAFIEDYIIKNGPFDGLMGFSQGAVLSAALPGMQRDGVALTKEPSLEDQSEMDTTNTKPESTALLESFVDPFVINHPKGHTVPKLDEKSTEVMLRFIERIQKTMPTDEE
ncbi:Serine hydrolase FSH - like 1 [Theobroma cacao]|nr:Serine hydrolase FSH - like 1 [Theobroma cacao]